MTTAPFTEEECQYIYQFKPAGFLRTWEALYSNKCHSGPWTISRRYIVFGALEKRNRMPNAGWTRFEPDIVGWHIAVPLGFGTVALWGYHRINR